MSRVNLLDLLPAEMEDLVASLGAPRYRGRQIASWLFAKGATDLEVMTDLPKDLRRALPDVAEIRAPDIERVTPSQDGSQKLVVRMADGSRVQSVLMPDEDRLTLCLSTQVGCGYACAFCCTGTMGLDRNLTAGEIVGQYLAARRLMPDGGRITHVVYMGMGEPLANYAATVKSLRILMDPHAIGLSPRRITISTVGLEVRLAISLHATTDEVRDRLMPVNKGFDLAALLAACRRFPLPMRQRMTFEYVLLDGVNDTPEDARRLVTLLHGIRAKVNLIPFNDWDGAPFERPPLQRVLAFQARLLEHGLTATVRWSKGEDIGAACGQLAEPATAAAS